MSLLKKCSVPGCSSQQCGSVSWFNFPDPNSLINYERKGRTVYFSKLRIWLEKLGLSDDFLARNAFVCSSHFKEEDFTKSPTGEIVLKDEAVPCLNLPPEADSNSNGTPVASAKEGSKKHENHIETVEEPDIDEDDDDVQIIEPHRETITLDDEDADSQALTIDTGSVENTLVKEKIPEAPYIPRIIKIKKGKKVQKAIIYPKDVALSPNRIIIPKPASVQSPTPEPDKPNRNTAIKSTEDNSNSILKKPPLSKSSVYKLQVFTGKNGSTLSQTEISDALKEQLLEMIQQKPMVRTSLDKISLEKAQQPNSTVDGKKLISIPTLELANKKKKGKQNASPDPKQPSSVIDGKKVFVVNKMTMKIASPISQTIEEVVANINEDNGQLNVSTPSSQVQEESNKTNKQVNPNKSIEIINLNKDFDEISVKEEPKDKVEEVEQPAPLGFAEMFNFIRDRMIGFTFDVFGSKYALKQCSLTFQTEDKGDKKVAAITASTLTSNDSFLLSGMNMSIAKSENKMEAKGFSRTVSHKHETIKFENIAVSRDHKNVENDRNKPKRKTANKECNYIERTVGTAENQKVVIHPKNFVRTEGRRLYGSESYNGDVDLTHNLTNTKQNDLQEKEKNEEISTTNPMNKGTDDDKMMGGTDFSLDKADESREKSLLDEISYNKRLMLKKKRNLKLSLARSRKVLPVSQMNPTLAGSFRVTGGRLKKGKRLLQDSEKEKRLLEKMDEVIAEGKRLKKRMDSDTSDGKDSTRETNGDTSEDTKYKDAMSNEDLDESDVGQNRRSSRRNTRSTLRAVKRDYKNFNLYGTSEETKIIFPKRRKSTTKSISPKKPRYSDKVGDMESFLEVVLEPESLENNDGTPINKSDIITNDINVQ